MLWYDQYPWFLKSAVWFCCCPNPDPSPPYLVRFGHGRPVDPASIPTGPLSARTCAASASWKLRCLNWYSASSPSATIFTKGTSPCLTNVIQMGKNSGFLAKAVSTSFWLKMRFWFSWLWRATSCMSCKISSTCLSNLPNSNILRKPMALEKLLVTSCDTVNSWFSSPVTNLAAKLHRARKDWKAFGWSSPRP